MTRSALAFGLVLFSVAGCDTVSDRVDEAACAVSGYADTGTVSATVAGSRFATACVRVDRQSGAVVITGADNVVSDQDQRVLAITVPSRTGTFSVDEEQATAIYTARAADASQQADQTYSARTGSVTVTTAKDDQVSGTFSFTARSPSGLEIEVSGGRFDVTD